MPGSWANSILIPMDEKQANHLKAYGIAYWILKSEMEVDWLLNYRGGSFMCQYHPPFKMSSSFAVSALK